jgi:hypothetical protein
VFAAGCLLEEPVLRDDDPGPGSTPTAREVFDTHVYPLVQARCGGCHEVGMIVGFVDRDATAAYDTMTGSGLVDGYADHVPLVKVMTDAHQGTYTDLERWTILDWLALERLERGL